MIWRVLLFAVLACFASACSPPTVAAQEWRLVDANTIEEGSYVILTVPLDEPEALSALATDLEEEFGVPLAAEWPLNSIDVHCLVYDARDVDVEALLEAMQADDRIRTAQRIFDFSTFEVTYSDPLFPLQVSLSRLNILAAHRSSLGEGIRVGVVDSAIDRSHPDLKDKVADARDFVARSPAPKAEEHGTAVAGVIGAAATNEGMVGVAPGAELVGLRACWQEGPRRGACNSFSLARAINFAILNDIDVLNLSLGGPEDPLIEELIAEALEAGIVIVAATGEGRAKAFPASLDGVIAAGAVSASSIPAPAVDVLSTAPGADHRYVSGSSIATAHVSGVVALMLAEDPGLTPAAIQRRLQSAVRNGSAAKMLDACVALLGTETACAS